MHTCVEYFLIIPNYKGMNSLVPGLRHSKRCSPWQLTPSPAPAETAPVLELAELRMVLAQG